MDSCVYDAAVYETGSYPPLDADYLEFPICETPSGFTRALRKIKPLPTKYREFIKAVQPCYEPKLSNNLKRLNLNWNLRILNDWARKDRHRFLHIARSWGANRDPQLTLPAGVELQWLKLVPDRHLEENPVIASFKLIGWKPDMDLEANPNLTIDVAIDEPPPPIDEDDLLGNRAGRLVKSVEIVVQTFEEISRRKP